MFVWNKSIIMGFKQLLLTKSINHNNTSSSEKVHLLLSSHIKIPWHISLVLSSVVNSVWSVNSSLLIQTRQPFHWRKESLLQSTQIRAKLWSEKCLKEGFVSYKHRFSLHKMLIDGLKWCGLLVDYNVFQLLILTAPIHCRGSIGEQMI